MPPISEYQRRIENVSRAMESHGIDCLLLNQTAEIKYLTGAENTCTWLFLKQDGRQVALVLESDYLEYRRQSWIEDVRCFRPHDPLHLFRDLMVELELRERSLAIEKSHLRMLQFEMLEAAFGEVLHRDFSACHLLQEARIIKTDAEIEQIAAASRLGVQGVQIAAAYAAAGKSELDLARHVKGELLLRGAGPDTYVYVGTDARSSMAHARPTAVKIEKGPIVLDVHVELGGLHSDVARTILLGEDPEQQSMYSYCRDHICRAIETVHAGLTMLELRRNFYRDFRPEKDWIVLTGPLVHGVGVANSEIPRFDYPFYNGYPEVLQENMALAMSNLGLYSPAGWGVRYEDTFVVTKGKPAVFTSV